jgi:imidazolonepropionase-like amidohydrolase
MVVTEGERIVYVGPQDGYPLNENTKVWETEDGTILPGFIDAHGHLTGAESIHRSGSEPYDLLLTAARDLEDIVASGVTGVRDMSAFGRPLRDAVQKGILKGPKIMPGGKVMSITSGHGDDAPDLTPEEYNRRSLSCYLVDGPESCYRAARIQFREGAKFLKICATGGVSSALDDFNDVEFSEDEIRVFVEEAKRHGTYVTAHCTGTEGIKHAVRCGVGCIEHGVMLDEEGAALMAEKKVPLVTTLTIALNLANMNGIPEHMKRKMAIIGDAAYHSFQLARKYHITVALGTDFSNSPNTPYRAFGREFYNLTRCGYTPMEALTAGTIHGAMLMKTDHETGSLEEGKLGDIVLVKGNPLNDIRILEDDKNIEIVMIDGKIVKNLMHDHTTA